jgi:hypothetical protein
MTASYKTAIAANISAMNDVLAQLAAAGAEAESAIKNNNQNGAVGALADFEGLINTAQSIHGTVLALHRQPK